MKAISITAISSRRSAEQAGETGDLLRTRNVKYFHNLEGTTRGVFAHQPRQRTPRPNITEPSSVLAVLSDHDLQTDYDRILEHFARELPIGGCQGLRVVERQARHRRQPWPDSFARSRLLRCAARSAANGRCGYCALTDGFCFVLTQSTHRTTSDKVSSCSSHSCKSPLCGISKRRR